MGRKKKLGNLDHGRPSLGAQYKSSLDLIDYDYLHLLTDDQMEFMYKFNNEYYKGSFEMNEVFLKNEQGEFISQKGKDLRKLRSVLKYYKDANGEMTTSPEFKYNDPLHASKDQRRGCNLNANASKRDVFGRSKALGKLDEWGSDDKSGDKSFSDFDDPSDYETESSEESDTFDESID